MVEPCQQHHLTLPPAAFPSSAAGKHEVGQRDPLLLNVICITHSHDCSPLTEPVSPNDQHCLFPSHLKQLLNSTTSSENTQDCKRDAEA